MSPNPNQNSSTIATVTQDIALLRNQYRDIPDVVRKEVELQLKPLVDSYQQIGDRVGSLEKQANDRLLWGFEQHKQITIMITTGLQEMEQRQVDKLDELRDLINQNKGIMQQTQITGQQNQLSTWQQVGITIGAVIMGSILSFISALYFAHALHP